MREHVTGAPDATERDMRARDPITDWFEFAGVRRLLSLPHDLLPPFTAPSLDESATQDDDQPANDDDGVFQTLSLPWQQQAQEEQEEAECSQRTGRC